MSDLASARACTSNQVMPYTDANADGLLDDPKMYWGMHPYNTYVGELYGPSDVKCLGWVPCGQEFCREEVRRGNADIWIDDKTALHSYLVMMEGACDFLSETTNIDFMSSFHAGDKRVRFGSSFGI